MRLNLSGGPRASVNMADSMEEVNMGGKRTQDMVHLLRCTTLYFVYRVFKKLFSSLALASPPWIQKQSTYRHSPYYPPCLQAREAKPRFGAALERSVHGCDTRLCKLVKAIV